jgi:hypothetical protein
VRSEASNLVNARVDYRVTPRLRLDVDVLNILMPVRLFLSRLPGEPLGGTDDAQFHPVEKFRVGIQTSF